MGFSPCRGGDRTAHPRAAAAEQAAEPGLVLFADDFLFGGPGRRRPFVLGVPGLLVRPIAGDRGAVDNGRISGTVVLGIGVPLLGEIGLVVGLAGRGHGRDGRLLDGILGMGDPGFLATGATDRPAVRPQARKLDGVGCRTMRADDMHGRALMHGRVLTMTRSRRTEGQECCQLCYRATVNEPETITAAKPVDRVWRSTAVRPAASLERS